MHLQFHEHLTVKEKQYNNKKRCNLNVFVLQSSATLMPCICLELMTRPMFLGLALCIEMNKVSVSQGLGRRAYYHIYNPDVSLATDCNRAEFRYLDVLITSIPHHNLLPSPKN